MTHPEGTCFTPDANGVRLAVRLTPRAGRDRVDGVKYGADGRPALHLRLAAPPVEGAANAALILYVARALDLPRGAVSLLSGATGRMKMLHLAGDPPSLIALLEAWIARQDS